MFTDKVRIIYVLGYSYSGSTLLGCLLASSKWIFNAGEVKEFHLVQEHGGELCSCGSNTLRCDFWSQIYRERYSLFRNTQWIEKLAITLRIVCGRKIRVSRQGAIHQDLEFFQRVQQAAKVTGHQAYFLLDNSKTLWRLNYLLGHPELEIKTVLINRGIFGNVSSCVKHGDGFIKGLLSYKVNSFLMPRYLDQSKTDYLQLDYEDLCSNPDAQMAKLGEFLDIDYTSYADEFLEGNKHLPSGNIGTRDSFKKNIPIHLPDQSWKKRLTLVQKLFIKLVNPKS